METRSTGWIWRDGELSFKEYQKLSSVEKDAYLEEIKKLPVDKHSTQDVYLIRMDLLKKQEQPDNNNQYKFLEL